MRSTTLILLVSALIALAAATCDVATYQCSAGALGCQSDHCLCLSGWRSTFPVSQVCEPTCGDNRIVGNEECDGGVGCCGCKCDNGFVPTTPRSKDCVAVQVPVATPVAAPVHVPVQAPVAAPVKAPVAAPVHVPVAVPVQPPTPCIKTTRTIADLKVLQILPDLFNTCFDLGVQVGVGGCNSFLNLTTSLSLTNLLSGIDLSLDLSLGNLLGLPLNLIRSLLSGQLVAAQLNLGLDQCSALSTCGSPLGNMCFKNNLCSGFTVDAVVQASQFLFGGCSNRCTSAGLPSALCNLSLAQISTCLGDFNSAFRGGSLLPLNGQVDVCLNL